MVFLYLIDQVRVYIFQTVALLMNTEDTSLPTCSSRFVAVHEPFIFGRIVEAFFSNSVGTTIQSVRFSAFKSFKG